ncbi:LppP/LprE family lipoprotein [Gloeobacter violaceus]|uniref:Glr2970 protein n=1 Tax=Gloeobacter violaceus (strain ATCC 29082 / PCC 7421) TaxID=251221 RepID=Q7NCK8_GLOVI|nr:LppP/LprE family lipoprotein [Gloeobacter violaceus]BAC90911.1 glr2970 [Gloeobacter violaceus PCC 7421]
MHNPIGMYQIGLALAATLALPAAIAAQIAPARASWLDQPLTNWNKPEGSVPRAPKPEGDSPTVGRCAEQVRVPASAEDRAVVGAGWKLFGPLQIFSGTSLSTAAASVDGMCRPMQYQAFVFVGGQFAGTLSPVPMNSRTDGASQSIYLTNPAFLNVSFSRYAEQDALCCPSRTSLVGYKIERRGKQSLLVPASVSTNANSAGQSP